MKRLFAIVLSVVLSLALLPTAMADEAAEEVYRYDEPVTLSVSVFDRGTTGGLPVDNNFWTRWIQENFGDPRNIKLEWVVIPRSEEVAKLNLLMASGDAADICFTYNRSVVADYVLQGGLVELSSMLDEYGPHIRDYLGEDVMKYGIFEGGLYSIPAKRVVLADTDIFVRSDWVKKLGMEMPTTRDEWYNMLVAFRDNNPGNADNVIPFSVSGGVNCGPLPVSFLTDLSERTFATLPQILMPGYEDYIVFMNKLYHEGLISKDFALDKDGSLGESDITSGRAGGYCSNYDHPIRVQPGLLASLQNFEPDADIVPVQCFPSATDPTKYYHTCYTPNGIYNFIPVYAEHPEAAIMYMDWLCDYDTLYFLQNGEEGKHHVLNEAGVPVLIDVNDDSKFCSMQNIDYTLLTNGQEFSDPELMIAAQAASYQGFEDKYANFYEVGNTDPLQMHFSFDVILKEDSKYTTALGEKENDIRTKAIMASPDEVTTLWPQLVQEYMDMGGQAVMDEKVAAYERMTAGK